jgi:Ni/Co efflux regulator RcnB
MKRAAVVGTILVSLMAGTAAMAGQGSHGAPDHRDPPRASFHDRHDRNHDGRYDYRGRYDDRGRYDNLGRYDNRRYAPPPRVVYRPAPRYDGHYLPPRGYVVHRWSRGERLPVGYYAPRYVVADYRDCGLRAPPMGYHWVRVNNDAVLAAVATGVVLDVAFNLFS